MNPVIPDFLLANLKRAELLQIAGHHQDQTAFSGGKARHEQEKTDQKHR